MRIRGLSIITFPPLLLDPVLAPPPWPVLIALPNELSQGVVRRRGVTLGETIGKMKLSLTLVVLFLVPVITTERSSDCSISDLVAFNGIIKSMVVSIVEKSEINCIDVRGSGSLASCPADTTVVSCACGMGCGSWDIQSKTTCHCQCANMDWTSARCCKIQIKS
ncbi:resistin-like beta [Xenopus laevis]|uniref:Resistin-like beta n=1 Tax=Xenopus laevis TaxID=8355 RepID=A0A8J0VJW9_XENLA|nr:resistin-like beta [Xenopus laevis]